MADPKIYRGLEGIYVDTTSISFIDGENGVLTYRGENIKNLVKKDFLKVVWLVLKGSYPKDQELNYLYDLFYKYSALENIEIEFLKNIPKETHPMKVLQGVIPLLNLDDCFDGDEYFCSEIRRGIALAFKIPIVLSSFHNIQLGRELFSFKKSLNFHQNFLKAFTGKMPSKEEVEILDIVQILQMEHGFNASTFSARVTASTLTPIECAISAAIGTLYGPLHGGADQKALEMALKIKQPENVENFLTDAFQRKEKIMGMGHRVYRVVDPRAKILKPMAKSLCLDTPFENLYLTLERVEDEMEKHMLKKGKRIKANIEFYKGAVFYALGISPLYFTSLFAMSRVFGYLAHIGESRIDNKLIRPKAFYRAS